MARDHSRIYHRIWADPGFRALTESAQRAYMLVLTQPELNYCGVTALSMHRWACLAADSNQRKVRKAIAELESEQRVAADPATEELLMRAFIENEAIPSSPNICINVVRTYPSILSPRLRATFLIDLHRLNEQAQEPGWEKGWAHLAPLLAEPIPEGLPEGFLEGFPGGLPKALRLARTRRDTRGSGSYPDPDPGDRASDDAALLHAQHARDLLAAGQGSAL